MAIKINENLKKVANYDPTKESKPSPLSDLCNNIYENKIVIPIFQTYIRWNLEKSVDLFNFQLNGKAAVSPISINIIENKDIAVEQISFITREPIKLTEKQIYSVNDGQQRLSCNYKAYINHEDFKSIVLDLQLGYFVINEKNLKSTQIPVGVLYNKDSNILQEFLKNRRQFQDFETQMLITKIRSKFMSYYYTINYARDLSQEEQVEWFDVLNLAGSRVTGVMIQLTQLLTKGVDYYKEYSFKFHEILEKYNLEGIYSRKDSEISIPLACLNAAYIKNVKNGIQSSNFSHIPSDVKANLISALDPIKIREIFKETLQALEMAIIFIKKNKLKNPERIDYITYLIGAHIKNDNNEFNKTQIVEVIKWYNEVVFLNKDNTQRREIFKNLLELIFKLK